MGDDDRLDSIFSEAVGIASPEERAAYIARACGPDAELRAGVERLIAAHHRAGSFLERPLPRPEGLTSALSPRPEGVGPGAMIGPYRLLQALGEGGMGEVWLAEQASPIKRRVALKLIKAGMDSAQVLRRFQAEQQALAMMDHPGIAKVFDSGAAESGRPYFVMEFIPGVAITRYCDELNLPLRERLGLFVAVCAAVQHAHQKGVIHRDIKPSNVLVCMVEGRPVPKVIDFGVAKALHQKLSEGSMYTEIGAVVGTLEYMPPEQAELSILDIDTRADIYALGVLLYELLTGSTPLEGGRLKKAAFMEVLRIIKEVEPPRPSTRLTDSGDALPALAAKRRASPAALVQALRGDLDWVVMKCLEKDRTRRYPTASELAVDVDHYLKDEPVAARPPSAWYRMGKFARRNLVALATAAAFVAVLAGSAVAGVWLALQARAAAGEAREAQGKAEAEAARAVAAEEGLAQSLQQVTDAKQQVEDAGAARDREAAIARAVNDFLCHDLLALADPLRRGRRDIPLREVLDRAAGAARGRLGGQPAAEAAVRHTIGEAYLGLGEYESAGAQLEEACRIRRKELGVDHPDTLLTLARLGDLHTNMGRMKSSREVLESALKVAEQKLGGGHRVTLECRDRLGRSLLEADDWEGAQLHLREATKGYVKALGEGHPDTLDALGYLACLQVWQGDFKAAEESCGQGLKWARWIADKEKKEASGEHRGEYLQAHFLFRYGMLHAARARGEKDGKRAAVGYDDADRCFDEARKRCESLLGPDHYYSVNVKLHQALAWHDRGRLKEAGTQLQACLEAYRGKLPPGHPTTALTWAWYADNLVARKEYRSAETEARAMREARTKADPNARVDGVAEYVLGAALVGLGKPKEAEGHLLAAYKALNTSKLAVSQGYVLVETCKALVDVYKPRGSAASKVGESGDEKKWKKWQQELKKAGEGRRHRPAPPGK